MHRAGTRQRTTLLLLVALAVLIAGCDKLLEIPGNDPHPPVISNAVAITPAVPAGGQLIFAFDYYDAGADVEIGKVRDKNSGSTYETIITVEENVVINPFPGVSGRATLATLSGVSGAQAGPHTLVIWVEDSNGSRSNTLEITFTLVI